jgi:hypothetical protein
VDGPGRADRLGERRDEEAGARTDVEDRLARLRCEQRQGPGALLDDVPAAVDAPDQPSAVVVELQHRHGDLASVRRMYRAT